MTNEEHRIDEHIDRVKKDLQGTLTYPICEVKLHSRSVNLPAEMKRTNFVLVLLKTKVDDDQRRRKKCISLLDIDHVRHT